MIEKIINPLLWNLSSNIDKKEIRKVIKTPPKYFTNEIVDLETWTGIKYGFKIVDIKITYHTRLNKWTWGYKLHKEGEKTGFSFVYVPEGYLRKI